MGILFIIKIKQATKISFKKLNVLKYFKKSRFSYSNNVKINVNLFQCKKFNYYEKSKIFILLFQFYFAVLSCSVTFSTLPDGKQIDNRLVGEWAGSEENNQMEGVKKKLGNEKT